MERALAWVLALLIANAAPMIIPQGGWGDPAPGRSPGPPHMRSFVPEGTTYNSEENTADASSGPIPATESWCDAVSSSNAAISSTSNERFQFQLVHETFSTEAGLVAGVYYQVAIKSIGSNKEKVSEIFVAAETGEWMGETYLQTCSNKTASSAAVKLLTERTPLSWRLPHSPLSLHTPANVTFHVLSRTTQGAIHEQHASYSVIKDCTMLLLSEKGSLSSNDLPKARDCTVHFPVDTSAQEPMYRRGLLIHLTRLNVPCQYGDHLELQGLSPPRRLCGKLEELNPRDRTFHFPADSLPTLRLKRQPIFSLNFTSVDFCYNVTLTSRNGSVALTPTDTLMCHFRIHLPYGNRVRLLLQVGEEPSTTVATRDADSSLNGSMTCDGLLVVVWNGASDWSLCSRQLSPKPNVEVESLNNVVRVHVLASGAEHYPTLRLWYSAVPVTDVVGSCAFGEVAINKYCAYPVHSLLTWSDAEAHCVKNGGHLLSIRDEHAQYVVDSLLLKSPEFTGVDSYWIGASDLAYEGHYQWSDGHAFAYNNWFPGWQQHGFYNKQPNDDGLSRQDCVEVRRNFPTPSTSAMAATSTQSYLWNDLDCSTPNYFLCERLRMEDGLDESLVSECNRSVTLSREHPRAVVTSPGFPYHYPDNVQCYTSIHAPPSYHIVLDFEELVLESEPMCSYDYLAIEEVVDGNGQRTHYCGDKSDKLKLLRYSSHGGHLKLLFVSDYSNHFGGFKARVSLQNARKDCADENQKLFNNFCYLFVGYPKVTWYTAQQICSGIKAHLASITSVEEENFVTSNLRKSWDYSTSTVFWLGGHVSDARQWLWSDGHPFNFTAWAAKSESQLENSVQDNADCLGLQWVSSTGSDGPISSGLYWAPNACKSVGGYVCKKPVAVTAASTQLDKTINGTEGFLSSPGFPGNYRPDLDYETHLVGPPSTRIVISLHKIDLENQPECLYDFLDLRSGSALESEQRWCGSRNTKLQPYNFVSQDNEAYVRFKSDYSVSGTGFSGTWKAVDVAGCPHQTLTAREGILSSPNYPEFILPLLDCTTTILAAPGKRVWLEFSEIDVRDEDGRTVVEVDVGGNRPTIKPLWNNGTIGGSNFVSWGEKLVVRLVTSAKVTGVGFRAIYRSVSSVHEEKLIDITSDGHGYLYHLNYPSQPPRFVDFVQHLVAPLGYVIVLEFSKVRISENGAGCPEDRGVLEISDNYADVNKTGREGLLLCPLDDLAGMDRASSGAPVAVTSYLHTLHVRQRSQSVGLHLNATLRVKEDPEFKVKISRLPDDMSVESCRPNPCLNGGKCLNSVVRKSCQCTSHFTGLFCALTQCELEPCLFGTCELTTNGYHCRCQAGYTGRACEQKQRPCADNPCEGRGECMERGDAFHCQCHAWWEGVRCERKMIHIPYKPLTERMLHEPFWLGLITVFVVLGVIGLFWCAKRHFPEKLEKLLAEEADRNGRSYGQGASRPASGRDHVGAGGSSAAQLHSPSTAPPRTLLSRLGIRKPSLLSLSSPAPLPIAAPRTFSLDDLLRSSPRRSPTLRKKRTNSTPVTKKNTVEKKQILQQLISPSGASSTSKDKEKISQIMQLKEKQVSQPADKSKYSETSFSANDSGTEDRMEKKVTFAKLINKVSAEMSSSSEVESTKPPLARAVSTPASPASARAALAMNQGDSFSSIEMTTSAGTSTLDIPSVHPKRPGRLNCASYRNPSADSLLAMLRSLGSHSNAPSPMEDSFCSEESLALDTPVSTSSGPLDSPIVIEVPETDSSASHKSSHNNFLQPPSIHLELPSGGINKCLSPIHEVPTPMSSPALTPIMMRTTHEEKVKIESSEEEKMGGEDTDEMTEGSSELVVEIHRTETPEEKLPALVIPILTIEEPSPKIENKSIPRFTFSGSPPPQKKDPCFPAPRSPAKKMLKEFEKPTSLDLPHPPPMIMVTCNASEGESDTESSKQAHTHNQTSSSSGMNYLSPFSMCSRGDRTASESNLSSSGYSSMASPGPSRCNSNNPLCLSEVEDQSGCSQPSSRRPSPLLRSPNTDAERRYRRRRSDSETMSDDPLVESNDEGIGTDHPEEKVEDSEVMKEDISFLDLNSIIPVPPPRSKKCDSSEFGCALSKTSLQLPTIVIQSDFCDKMLSPVSSRSESPLSDKTLGLGRFSPMFYCKNKSDQLPFTDSDGLYDFPSSDCPPSKHKSAQGNAAPHRKRRDRRASTSRSTCAASGTKSPSPTKGVEAPTATRGARKPSPKRRMRTQAPPSSSSSAESLTFGKGNVSIRLTSPDGTEWPVRSEKQHTDPVALSNEASCEDTGEELTGEMDSPPEEISRPKRNLSRLRSIAHQIRFLRRIEYSLKRKERTHSQSDSCDEEDTQSATKSLLPRAVRPKIQPAAMLEMRKSNSNSLLAAGRRRKTRGTCPHTRNSSPSTVSILHGLTD